MEPRLMILIFALLCLAGIRSEVSDERESGDGFEHDTDDHDCFLRSFAEASLKVITKGTKIDSLSNDTDIHQQLDYAKTFLLSEKENATNNLDLQHELEHKIEVIEFLSRLLNYSEGNAEKEKLENLNGYKNLAWRRPTKMENLDASGGMLLEDPTLEQYENGQYIVKSTIFPSSENFGETANKNITLKHDILNQSQNGPNLEQIAFPTSTELLPGATNGNMPLKNDIREQSRNSQNRVKTIFSPRGKFFGKNATTEHTVFNTDSEHMKDITEIPTDNIDSGELFFKSVMGSSLPKSKTNSSHLNTANASEILPFSPIGKFSRRDENQNYFYPNRNSDTKAAKIERILNAWKILLDEIDETKLDKHEFFNSSSTTSVTGVEMNTTDPTSHPPELDESTPSTLEISYVSYSTKELPTLVDDANSTMFNASHKNNELRKITSPSGKVSLKMNTMEMNTTDPTSHPPEFDESTSSTIEISYVSYSTKELPTVVDDVNSTMFNASHKNNELGKTTSPSGDVSLEMTTFGFMKDKGKRSGKAKDITDRFVNTLENKTDHSSSFAKSDDSTFNDTKLTFKNQLPWIENIPLNFTGDSKEASSFIAFETKEFESQSDLENNKEKNASTWNLPTPEKQRSNVTEDEFENSQATTLPSAIEGLKGNDRQQSFLGKNAKLLENMAPEINADEENSRFPVTFISVNKEPSAVRNMTQEYENKLEQSRSALKDIYSRETESGQFREHSRVSNFEDSEKGNIMGFTNETQKDQIPWKNPLYHSLFKIPTGFERFENEHAAKTDNSTINKKMEEKSSAVVKILISLGNGHAPGHQNKRKNNTMVHVDRNVKPGNMEENFLNGSSQSLQSEIKPFGVRHSNKVPNVYSSIKIEYNEYIRDKDADEIAKGDFRNLQVVNSPNNETSQFAKIKRSGGKDHW